MWVNPLNHYTCHFDPSWLYLVFRPVPSGWRGPSNPFAALGTPRGRGERRWLTPQIGFRWRGLACGWPAGLSGKSQAAGWWVGMVRWAYLYRPGFFKLWCSIVAINGLQRMIMFWSSSFRFHKLGWSDVWWCHVSRNHTYLKMKLTWCIDIRENSRIRSVVLEPPCFHMCCGPKPDDYPEILGDDQSKIDMIYPLWEIHLEIPRMNDLVNKTTRTTLWLYSTSFYNPDANHGAGISTVFFLRVNVGKDSSTMVRIRVMANGGFLK